MGESVLGTIQKQLHKTISITLETNTEKDSERTCNVRNLY